MANLEELLRERAALVTEIEEFEKRVEDKKRVLKGLDDGIMAKFDAEGVSSTKIPGLGSFILQTRYYASIPEDRKDVGIAVIKKHYPSLVKESVNSQTLSAWWNEFKKSGETVPQEIVDVIKESMTRFLQWRR
jgi:hypothetical protein